jgi:hypothetical protein
MAPEIKPNVKTILFIRTSPDEFLKTCGASYLSAA